MNRYFFALFTIVILTSANINAQDKLTIDTINFEMDKMLQESSWHKMISYGENALREGFDFFFLRARLGIAYYETKNYFKAIPQFERALEIGYDNPTVLEDLYYCYFYTGREEDKNFIFKQLPENLKDRIKPLNNYLADNLHFDFGSGISNDYDKNSSIYPDVSSNFYSEQTIEGNAILFNVGLNQLPIKSVNVIYDYTYLKLSKTKQIQYNYNLAKYSNEYSEYQNRFYNCFNIRADKGLIISPAGQFIGTDYSTIYALFDSTSADTASYYYTIIEQEKKLSSFVLSLDVSKYISIFKFGITGSFSYLNDEHQSQFGLTFKIFPTRKVNFYSNSNLVLQNQNSVANLIFDQSFGGMFGKNFWYNAFVTVGEMSNYNEQNGAIVYNTDMIKYKLGVGLKYYPAKNFRVNFLYSFQNRERDFDTYTLKSMSNNIPSYDQIQTALKYQVNNFVLGLNYSF